MTSDQQLDRWGKKNIPGFQGVFMSDQLAEANGALWRARHLPERSLIFNYDDSRKPGSHWVGLRISDRDGLEWIDSFGTAPDQDDQILRERTHFREFCEQNAVGGRWTWNKLDMQALKGETCGQYALWGCKYGIPDPSNHAWLPVFEAGGSQPPQTRSVIGLRKVDQVAAGRRDEKIVELVGPL